MKVKEAGLLYPSDLITVLEDDLSHRDIAGRVDLSNATEDYPLAVGEEAIINFTDATRVPLHIATQDGTVYELHLIPSNTGGTSGGTVDIVSLAPNNTSYSNSFVYAEILMDGNGLSSFYITYSYFRIAAVIPSVWCVITNRTVYKNIKGIIDKYGSDKSFPDVRLFSTDWRNTTTPWTSLGTITFPQPTSGQILVRRLV